MGRADHPWSAAVERGRSTLPDTSKGRGATASRPFAEKSLMKRASYPDPTKSVRLRTPRSGAPTQVMRKRLAVGK